MDTKILDSLLEQCRQNAVNNLDITYLLSTCLNKIEPVIETMFVNLVFLKKDPSIYQFMFKNFEPKKIGIIMSLCLLTATEDCCSEERKEFRNKVFSEFGQE